MFDILLKGDIRRRLRVQRLIGFFTVVVIALAAIAVRMFLTHTESAHRMNFVINTPYAGQGVKSGTEILLRGVAVGKVSRVTPAANGSALLSVDIDRSSTDVLKDQFRVDFRPNFFGVTTVDLSPEGGAPIRPGSTVVREVSENATLAAVLSNSSTLVSSVLTPRNLELLDRVSLYAPVVAEAVRTGLTIDRTVSRLENQQLTTFLRSMADVSGPTPLMVDQLITIFSNILGSKIFSRDKAFWNRTTSTLDFVATGIFPPLGRLFASNRGNLQPAADLVVDLLKFLGWGIKEVNMPQRIGTVMTALQNSYSGASNTRALQVRLSLARLPAVAAPMSIPGVS